MKSRLLLVIFILKIGILHSAPAISIITSVYKGERFIQSFLEDMVQQTIFDQCELIIVNANSPENEEPIIKEFQAKYPNIHYHRLPNDPGIYGVWNYAIDYAQGTFLTNANIDDRLAPECYERYLTYMNNHPTIDVVYSDFYVTYKEPLCTFTKARPEDLAFVYHHDFSLSALRDQAFLGPHPFWKKSLHTRFGLFNNSFKIAGDWEFWLRCATRGAQFARIPIILGLYYQNPHGLSTSSQTSSLHAAEDARILKAYGGTKKKKKKKKKR